MFSRSAESRTRKASYAWCRRVCRRSGSSFFSSFALLDSPRRNAMYALYAFARISDDLADSSSPHDLRRRQLADWRAQTMSALSSPGLLDESSVLSRYAGLWPALQDSVQRFAIPYELLDEVICGVSMDVDHQTPRDWDDLKNYCYHVASAVGIACTYIWRSGETVPRQSAIDCGYAFQLTNILRDVAEDARSGRIYIPLSLLAHYDIDRDQWLAGKPNGRWQDLIQNIGGEAERLYESGWSTMESLTPESQRMFSLMWHSYRRLLDQVLLEKSTLWDGRKPTLSRSAKFRLLARHAASALFKTRIPTSYS